MVVSLELAESWKEGFYSKAESLGHGMGWARWVKQSDRGLGEVSFGGRPEPDRCRELPEFDRASLAKAIPGWYGAALLDPEPEV